MEERKQEIILVMDIIQKLCVESKICLMAREKNGVKYVGIMDVTNDKEYVLSHK